MTEATYAKLKASYPSRIVLVREGDEYHSHGDCAARLAQAGIIAPFAMKDFDLIPPVILKLAEVVIGEVYRPPVRPPLTGR